MSFPPLPGMYFRTESPWKELKVTQADRNIASIILGWTLGFGFFVGCKAVRETRRVGRLNTYCILIWGELLACCAVMLQAYLYLQRVIQPTFWFFFFVVVTWAIQVQFLLQIIVNRLCILLDSNKQRNQLRWTIAALITFINVSVWIVWMPAKLQISQKWITANLWYDRVEKVLYLIIDGCLNWYFIRTVKTRLIEYGGLKKYQRLVRYNTQIIWVSLGMDALIIAMMSMPNELCYLQFHPVAYLAKLNIEMAMSTLIIKVARETGVNVDEDSTTNKADTTGQRGTNSMQVSVQITRTQHREDIELTDQSPRVWSTTTQKPDLAGSPKSSVELGLDMGVRKDRFD